VILRGPNDLRSWRSAVAEAGLRILFTNGCYDILHAGHVRFFEALRGRYKKIVLLVALNTDAGITRLKGPARPLNTLENRMCVVAANKYVDAVTWFDEDTPVSLIELIKPEVLAKGGEYSSVVVPGEPEVLAYGGEVCKDFFFPGISTTGIVDKMLKA